MQSCDSASPKIRIQYSSLSCSPNTIMEESFIKNNEFPREMKLLLFLFQLLLLFSVEVNSYAPDENLAINCGYSGGNITLPDGRTWVGDFPTMEPETVQPSATSNASNRPPSSVNIAPFGTARLSHSKFTYSVPVNNGPKFLRLHFYPTTYLNNFEPINALFSVSVGNLTLLKDFNASLWVQNDENTINKEYIINVQTGETQLNVTFTPTTNESYAFINGIEVVSMPPFLYYSDPNDLNAGDDFKLVGSSTSYSIDDKKSLETLYRVNVGGGMQVPPNQDTGMFRDWENDYPRYYVGEQHPRSTPDAFGHQLNYRNNSVPDYTAPALVYLTARSYGMDATANYNVTWNFVVDSQFNYMVRLHFCELAVGKITRYGERVFQIFIAETLAEGKADVIGWSDGILVPVHRDYAVLNFPSEGKGSNSVKTNLSIKLQRMPNRYDTRYYDVILNGIELFKISDENNNLAGPNPQPPIQSPRESQAHSSKSSTTTTVTIVVVVVAVSGLILASAVGILVFRRRRRRSHDTENKKNEGSSSLPSHLCRYFTIAEIRAATNNFDDVFIIGVGGFGNVFKGYIDGGSTPVAIKRLKPGSQQGEDEFLNEIEMLSQLRHIHLVSLIGYCNDGAEMILVYEFMEHGTLRECLYNSDKNNNRPLTWKQRLEILLGAARGLHYLHAGAKHNIIHRDVKSTNILLDEKWVAKVSDFGLSKVGPTGTLITHVSTVVKGSIGYLDPEYYKRQRLTLKSDVYSFGVVLLEVLCARPPLVRTQEKKKVSLVDWFRRCYEKGGIYEIEEIMDPFLKDSISDECLRCYCQMALSCLHDDGNQRPAMSDVVGVLDFALQLVVVSDEVNRKFVGTQEDEKSDLMPRFMGDDHGSDGVMFTSSDDFGSGTSKVTTISASTEEENPLVSATVFSEIGNPTAR